MSSFTPPIAPGISARLTLTLDGLYRACAARMARNPAIVGLLMLACARFRRAAARFATLAVLASQGRVPPRRIRPRRTQDPARPSRPWPRLPRGRYWLIRLAPEANCFASQLQHLLADPGMAALLQAAPQAGRILRPLCRMLAVRIPPILSLPILSLPILSLPAPAKPPRSARPQPVARPPRRSPPEYGTREPSPRIALRRMRALAGIPPPPHPA